MPTVEASTPSAATASPALGCRSESEETSASPSSDSTRNSGAPRLPITGRATGAAAMKTSAPSTPPTDDADRLAPSASAPLPLRCNWKPSIAVAASEAEVGRP